MSDERVVTIEEIKELLKKEKIPPSKVFDSDQLLKDEVIRDQIHRQADLEVDIREDKKKRGENDTSHIPDDPGESGGSGDSDDGKEADHIPD